MYEVCNVSGRGKADSVVLHGRWFQVELHGGSSICGCRPCDGQHAKQHGGGRGSGVAIVHGLVLSVTIIKLRSCIAPATCLPCSETCRQSPDRSDEHTYE